MPKKKTVTKKQIIALEGKINTLNEAIKEALANRFRTGDYIPEINYSRTGAMLKGIQGLECREKALLRDYTGRYLSGGAAGKKIASIRLRLKTAYARYNERKSEELGIEQRKRELRYEREAKIEKDEANLDVLEKRLNRMLRRKEKQELNITVPSLFLLITIVIICIIIQITGYIAL